jgi:hypothetical protein
MGFWIFKSPKEKALDQLRKDVHAMYTLALDEYEDTEIEELSREVHQLKQLFTPEEPAPATPSQGLPNDVIEGIIGIIPESFRGLARAPIRKLLSDPRTVDEIKRRLIPILEKQPAKTEEQPIDAAYSLHGYVPQQ